MNRLKSLATRKKQQADVDDDAMSVSTLESGMSATSRQKLTGRQSSSHTLGRPGSTASMTRTHTPGYDGASDAGSEISAGPEKWRRIRRGAHLSYVPFDVEDYQEAAENEDTSDDTFPPRSEVADNSKNWPKPCPFLHLKFADFAIADKQSFISTAYYFWYFLIFLMLWNLGSAIIASLISPTPKPAQVYFAFVFGFVGFWWFFFAHFRLLYHAMRYRKEALYTLYQLETVCLIFIACYELFSNVGNMVQLLSPLAPGSPVPVRQNPMVATIMQAVSTLLWLVTLFYCFFFIRKSHYFKGLPLSVEKEIWRKERLPGALSATKKKLSEWLLEKFREKPDKPHVPVRCGLLQGKDLWLQGQLTLETVYLEFKADVHVFDHLVWERYHYQDVLSVRKYGKSGILFQVVNPSKSALEDLEVIFDFSDAKLRKSTYDVARNLWRRVGRNMDLLSRLRAEKIRKMRRPNPSLDNEETDMVEAFNKARRMETRERLMDHMVTYKDWQKILMGVQIHVLSEGEPLLTTGDDFTRLYHVAQGRIEVSEVVDNASSSSASQMDHSIHTVHEEFKDDPENREQKTWAKYSARRAAETTKGGKIVEEKSDSEPLEYEDPDDLPQAQKRDIENGYGSGSDSDHSDEDQTISEFSSASSAYSSDLYSVEMGLGESPGPETVLLGTLRKDDIFGVVPFLLTRDAQVPRSGLTFTARDPITVLFSIDSNYMKGELLKPKKDVTSSFYKYLAVILGERTEAAEDAMFTRKVREKRLEVARAEEAMLAKQRQEEEDRGFSGGAPVDTSSKDYVVRQIFNFTAAEMVVGEYKGKYTYRDPVDKKVVKIPGTFYITSHYYAFCGKKFVDTNRMEINRMCKDIMRHDEIITIRYEATKGVLFTDQRLDRKMFEVKDPNQRDNFYRDVCAKWKSEDEVTSKEMRKLLRRKMTRLSLGYLNQAERLTQQTIATLMGDMTEKEKKQLFAGSVPIGLNRNQVVIGEHNFNDNLYLLCTGIVRVQRIQEHVSNILDSGKAMDRVVFQEIHSGEIFGFDSFLTGSPAYSSVVVDSEKAVVRSCTKEQIMTRLREDRKLAAKFYRIAAVSIAARLAEISPLDIYL